MSDSPQATAPLPDGTYDVFIVDAIAHPDDESRVLSVELTLTTGEHKGLTFALAAGDLRGSDIELMGMPGTLRVTGGTPKLTLD